MMSVRISERILKHLKDGGRIPLAGLMAAMASALTSHPATAQILADRRTGCENLIVNFRPQQPFNPANTYLWELGRGPATSKYDPVGVYPTVGDYPVKLVITLPNGTSNTYYETIRVFPKPDLHFKADDTSGCFPHHVAFQDRSVPGAGTITYRSWFFGDGTVNTMDAAPKHVYRDVSNRYTVTLRVVQSACPQDTFTLTRSSYIHIFEGVKPDFEIPPPTSCLTPVDLTLVNRSTTGPRQTLRYEWTIGGATPSRSTAKDPVIRFPANGTFPARLVVRSDSGCVDSIEKPVRISTPTVRSDFRSSYDTVCQGVLVDFQNLSSPSPDTSLWYFGSEPGVKGLNQFKVFQTTGNVTVKLVNRFGSCLDSITKTIHVLAAPQISLNSPNRYACRAPRQVDFTYSGAAASTLTRIEWDFGDGTATRSAGTTISHTYTREGSFPVALTAYNSFGCSSRKIVDSFVVIAAPRIIPIKMVDSGCVNLLFRPRADIIAPDGLASQSWTFGEGAPAQTSPTPSYLYTRAQPGPYPVTLNITTQTGCTASASGYVLIGTLPTAPDFSGLPQRLCTGDTVRFKGTHPGTTPVTGWFWQFGDGGTSRERNSPYVYQDTGLFTVKLTVFNNGCASTTASKMDYIRIDGAAARYIFVPDCTDRFLVKFTNNSYLNVSTFEWDFGDGSPKSNSRDPAPHRFPGYGSYPVTLKATSGACTMTHQLVVNLLQNNTRFTARSSLSSATCRDAVIAFNAVDNNTDFIRKYEWDFGDGNFEERGPSTSRVFTSNGIFTTRLRTTNINGCSDTITGQPLIIGGPVVGFHAPERQGCKGLEVVFQDTTRVDMSGGTATRTWSFGDGNTFNAPPGSLTAKNRYNNTGSYQVKLVVVDFKGCSDSMVLNGYVTITQAKAAFSSPNRQSCPGSPVSFLNESQLQGGTFSWDFGDGNRSTKENPTHNYATSGIYAVALTVRDYVGCQASDTQKAYILVDKPVSSFQVDQAFSLCPPLKPNFLFKGSYVRDLSWEFGDGNRSSLQSPNQIYLYPGTYPVRLVVTSPGGCRDTAVQNIRILGPMGTPSLENLTGCDTVNTLFRVLNASDVDSVIWDFDDGAAITKSLFNAHAYTRPGFYAPSIILKNANGCRVTLPVKDTVKTYGVIPGFQSTKSVLCDMGSVTFLDTSRIVGRLRERSWDFGNGTGSGLPGPTVPYTTPGVYPVSLKLTTLEGCSGRIAAPTPIRIVRTPKASISGNVSVCLDKTLTLRGLETTTPRDTSILRWRWDFGNGQTSTSASPLAQSYPKVGNYSVTLLLSNSSGCTDTVVRTIRVDSIPDIVLPPDTTVCLGQPLMLQATGANTYRWLPPAKGISCTTCAGVTALPDSSTSYQVQGTNSFGCVGLDSIRVEVIRPRTVTTTAHDTMCIGGSVQLRASGNDFFTWSPTTGLSNPNIANPIARPTVTTVYMATGYDRKNCFRSVSSTRVMVYNYPSVFAGNDVTIRSGGSISFKPVTTQDVTTYRWTPSEGLSCTSCPNPVASPKLTTTYKLTAANPGGCSGWDEVKVAVVCEADNIYMPNTFSPNGDGINEVFYPRGSGLRSIRSLRIFNRWGELVFQRQDVKPNDPTAGWDGRYKGRLLPPDVYVYIIDVICDNKGMVTRKGDVALIR
jgi:gliding motility-associated-like protein